MSSRNGPCVLFLTNFIDGSKIPIDCSAIMRNLGEVGVLSTLQLVSALAAEREGYQNEKIKARKFLEAHHAEHGTRFVITVE